MEALDVGMERGTPVSEVYRKPAPYAFTGKLENVVIETK